MRRLELLGAAAKILLETPPFGQIPHNERETWCGSIRPHRDDQTVRIEGHAAAPNEKPLRLVPSGETRLPEVLIGQAGFSLAGPEQDRVRLADRLGEPMAEQPFGTLVPAVDGAGSVQRADRAVRQNSHENAEAVLRLPQPVCRVVTHGAVTL
jgi:hypothetical protein